MWIPTDATGNLLGAKCVFYLNFWSSECDFSVSVVVTGLSALFEILIIQLTVVGNFARLSFVCHTVSYIYTSDSVICKVTYEYL